MPSAADATATDSTCRFRVSLRDVVRARRRLAESPGDLDAAIQHFFAMGGRDDAELMRRMRADPVARKLFEARQPMPRGILEPQSLRDLPKGSLGHEYAAHIERLGLDPAVLSARSRAIAAPYLVTEEHGYVWGRQLESHDLWHVLTGYGVDLAGEGALLAFTYAQTGNRAYALLPFFVAGYRAILRGRFDVLRSCWQGYRAGRHAEFLHALEWGEWLERPLAEVRGRLGLEPARYRPFSLAQPAAGAV
jgi:ubiquinone biosynthesis protein COQ4